MKTVLMFSRYFPPMFSVGGKRAYRFARYLPQFGWHPVVVTAPLPRTRALDPSAGRPLDPGVAVERSYYPDLGALEGLAARLWPERGGDGLSDGTVGEPIREPEEADGGLLERLARQAAWPLGNDLVNLPRWAVVAARLARVHGADAIFATSSPYSALLLGAVARAVTGLPLCLDLRDPWSLNFGQRSKPTWVQAVERWAEHRLLSAADRVTFTCESVISAYREQVPVLADQDLTCIYNSFDPEQALPRDVEPSGPLQITHFGNVYGGRSLELVIRALAALRRDRGLGPEQAVLRNLGRIRESDLRLARELGVESQVSTQPFLPYEEGLKVLAASDLQLLLAYGQETLFVPAKLYDYFLTGRPILCLSPPSELTRIVTRTRSGTVVSPGDLPGMVAALEHALALRRRQAPEWKPDAEEIARFSAPHTAAQLARLLDGMVAAA